MQIKTILNCSQVMCFLFKRLFKLSLSFFNTILFCYFGRYPLNKSMFIAGEILQSTIFRKKKNSERT